MNTMQWLAIVLASGVAAGAAVGGCCWWYGRLVRELRGRIDKLERARQVASQHFAQSRNQIEQLQKELVAAQKARVDARSEARAQSQTQASRRQALSDSLDAATQASFARDPLPSTGFADTQPA